MKQNMNTLALRCRPLDDLLGGGIESGIITKLFGEGGTGKTNILLQACRECVRAGYKAAYIDTEGVSVERLRQICTAEEYASVLDQIVFFDPPTLKDQEKVVKDFCTVKTIKLLVIDTMNMLYRAALEHDAEWARRSYIRQMTSLQVAARTKNLCIIIAEQVYTDKNDDIKPFTTKETGHMVKTVLKLERKNIGRRQATLLKHRYRPEGTSAVFRITAQGLE